MYFKQINRATAKRLFNEGVVTIYAMPSKMRESQWVKPVQVWQHEGNFEQWCNSFSYYNCNNETGNSIKFYIEDKS